MRRTQRSLLALVMGVALFASACAGDDPDEPAETPEETESEAVAQASESEDAAQSEEPTAAEVDFNAMLPSEIRDAGVIKSGGPVSIPPRVFLEEDGETRTGFFTDLMAALGDRLGVDISYDEMPFPSLIPGLEGGSIDMTVTVSDTAERQEVLDFVDFLDDGIVILVAAGNPEGVDSLESLCGKTAAVLSGSIADQLVATQNEACVSDGAEEIEIKQFNGASDAQLAVRSGQADLTFGGKVALTYVAANAEGGTVYDVAPGGPYTSQPDAFAFIKGNDELRDAVQAALQSLVDDGTYESILSEYGVTEGLYDQIPINDAG